MTTPGRPLAAWVVAALTLSVGCATSPELDAYAYACLPGQVCAELPDASADLADVALPPNDASAPDVADAKPPPPDPGPVDVAADVPETDLPLDVTASPGDTLSRDGIDVDASEPPLDVTPEVAPRDDATPVDVAPDVGPDVDRLDVAEPADVMEADAVEEIVVDPCEGISECEIAGGYQCLQLGNLLQQCVTDPATGCLTLVDLEACVDGDPCTADLCIPAQGTCSFPPGDEGVPCPGGQCHAGFCDAFLVLLAIDGGDSQTCALRSDGSVWCWGRQTGGIGDGTPTSTVPSPVEVAGFGDALALGLDVGVAHACAWTNQGEVLCWGHGADGRLGHGTLSDKSIATAVEGLADAVAVAAGGAHSCAIDEAGALFCWGANDVGQIGDGTASPGDVKLGPSLVEGLAAAAAGVVAGSTTTCARLADDGSVSCWGAGQPAPAPVLDGDGAPLLATTTLAAGDAFTCALVATTPWCWGELGDGSPHAVPLPSEVSGLAAGGAHACLLELDGGLSCVGANAWAQLGDGSQLSTSAPTLAGLLAIEPAAVGAGGAHTCAIDGAGSAWCWGLNRRGQLGFGLAGEDSDSPLPVSAVASPAQVTVGESHVCATSDDGVTACWGAGADGQLGDGSAADWPAPVTLPESAPALSAVSAGATHTCGLDSGGIPSCWGDGVATPVVALGVPPLSTVAAGDGFTCGAAKGADADTVTCWGASDDYDGVVTLDAFPDPVEVLAAGDHHVCAVLDGGALWCWGVNDMGQLGNGAVSEVWTPPTAAAISNISSVACGAAHTCVVDSTGGAWCWGAGERGQLGDGLGTTNPLPVMVALGDTTVAQPAAGRDHTCAVAAGQLRCWGGDDHGELGPGSEGADALTPVAVEGVQSVTSLSAGGDATCMVSAAGLSCWGDNGSGQLGDGSLFRREPVKVLGLP